MKYTDETEILKLVEIFENGAVAKGDWRHAEHLTVALFYLSNFDYETALTKMRGGIFNLLKSFGIDLSKEMPYHETLTVFWMRTVDDFRNLKSGSSVVEICNDMIVAFDKDYPLRFYSRARLFSDTARDQFVEADLPITNITPPSQ